MDEGLKIKSIEYLNVETRLFAPPTKISGYSPGSQFEEVEWFIERKSSFLWQTVWERNLQLHLYVLVSKKRLEKTRHGPVSFFDVYRLTWNLMLKPERFDVEMTDTGGITGNEWCLV